MEKTSDNTVTESPRFIAVGGDCLRDTRRHLVWSLKDSWQMTGKWMSWHHVRDFIADLNRKNFGGYGNWRLPSGDEARSLYDRRHQNKDYQGQPAHLHPDFPAGFGFLCWTSDVRSKIQAMRFGYRKGVGMYDDIYRESRGATRPVRDIPREERP